jgi:hypothetical protein
MKWLADENIPKGAIAFLRQHGEDVVAIAESNKRFRSWLAHDLTLFVIGGQYP